MGTKYYRYSICVAKDDADVKRILKAGIPEDVDYVADEFYCTFTGSYRQIETICNRLGETSDESATEYYKEAIEESYTIR